MPHSDEDAIQAYCDVLETKWLHSEQAGRDIELQPALDAHITARVSAPQAGDRIEVGQ